MRIIPLTKGAIAIVDACDFEMLMRFSWQLNEAGYAVCNVGVGRQHVTIERMHRIIMRAPPGVEVDHINGNTLDNRRVNLRLATHQENSWNQKKRRGSSSAYKGVCWHSQNRNWRVRIKVSGKEIALGCYASEVDAAKAYNAAAIKHFGEFARLNIITG